MSEDFLSRWSRRKDEARRAEPASPPEPDRAAEPALTPEELAALPKLDELTADSDITGFLRRGVPEGLRNAALRKMWLLDPAIRDFVGPARDYSYDWNAPAGVPGNGPLAPEHVAALLRRVFGEPEPAPAEAKTAADKGEAETPTGHGGTGANDDA
jgi:hypothetical protein